MKRTAWILLALVLTLGSCINFKGVGSDLGEGFSTKTDTIGSNLMHGVASQLTSDEQRKKLASMIDELVTRLGTSVSAQGMLLRDSLTSEYTRRMLDTLREGLIGSALRGNINSLIDAAIGSRTKELLGQLRTELVGPHSRELLSELVRSLRNTALGDSTQLLIADVLHGALVGANGDVKNIVDSAVLTLARRYKSDLKPQLEDLSFLQRNVTEVLITVAVLALIIIGFVWWQKEKYLRLTRLLATQIHSIPDDQQFQQLKQRIHEKAKETGLEMPLRKILQQQGLLGPDARATVPTVQGAAA